MAQSLTSEYQALLRISDKLNQWADDSLSGGWSTHQVRPMRTLAAEIRESVRLRNSNLILEEMES